MVTVLVAQFERDLIRSPTSEGRARARARGIQMGRPHELTPQQQGEEAAQSGGVIADRDWLQLQRSAATIFRLQAWPSLSREV